MHDGVEPTPVPFSDFVKAKMKFFLKKNFGASFCEKTPEIISCPPCHQLNRRQNSCCWRSEAKRPLFFFFFFFFYSRFGLRTYQSSPLYEVQGIITVIITVGITKNAFLNVFDFHNLPRVKMFKIIKK